MGQGGNVVRQRGFLGKASLQDYPDFHTARFAGTLPSVDPFSERFRDVFEPRVADFKHANRAPDIRQSRRCWSGGSRWLARHGSLRVPSAKHTAANFGMAMASFAKMTAPDHPWLQPPRQTKLLRRDKHVDPPMYKRHIRCGTRSPITFFRSPMTSTKGAEVF